MYTRNITNGQNTKRLHTNYEHTEQDTITDDRPTGSYRTVIELRKHGTDTQKRTHGQVIEPKTSDYKQTTENGEKHSTDNRQ